MTGFFLQMGTAFLLIHEMDAIRCKEWRIFPGLSRLDDDTGFKVFMFMHAPLYWLVLQVFVRSGSGPVSSLILAVFLVLHLVLHLLFLKHPKNEFKDWASWATITLAALPGALYLAFSLGFAG